MKNLVLWGTFLAVPVFLLAAVSGPGNPDNTSIASDYKLLTPISHGDLTIFPVVSVKSHDTSSFLTLDEGIRSGKLWLLKLGPFRE